MEDDTAMLLLEAAAGTRTPSPLSQQYKVGELQSAGADGRTMPQKVQGHGRAEKKEKKKNWDTAQATPQRAHTRRESLVQVGL